MIYKYGNVASTNVLIQPVDDHDMAVIENELAAIKAVTEDFCLIAVKVDNWNKDLSPWEAPAVFGNDAFGGGAGLFLDKILELTKDRSKKYYIGGYSLAGLFALWAAYQTDVFAGVAAASPSIWLPGFTEYMRNNRIKTDKVYLSLGNREEKTKNPVMATVGERIREAREILTGQGTTCLLEWNEGNHFKEPDLRTAKAFRAVQRPNGMQSSMVCPIM
ncbi:MAG: esterase [Lachnospiraceae bacterium]|nr:esterase [Lachnospiraceae bacterium]